MNNRPTSATTVEVEIPFYEKLISTAYLALTAVSFGTIRERLQDSIARAQDIEELTTITREFTEEREFISEVCVEESRITGKELVA